MEGFFVFMGLGCMEYDSGVSEFEVSGSNSDKFGITRT